MFKTLKTVWYKLFIVIVFLILPIISLDYETFKKNHEQSWAEFHINISTYLKYTPFVNIIEGRDSKNGSYDVRDFHDFLTKHLQMTRLMSLNLCKPNISLKDDCRNLNKAGSTMEMNSILFIIYASHNNIDLSFREGRGDMYRRTSPFVLFLVSMEREFADTPCSSPAMIITKALEIKFGNVLDKIWKTYRILEMYVFLPLFCGSRRILKFDHLVQGDPSSRIRAMTDEVYKTDSASFSQLMKDFKKYPLRISAFQREPTLVSDIPSSLKESYYSKDIEKTKYLGGVDGFFIGNLVKKLNFEPIFSTPADKQDYGLRLQNGSLTGSLSDIANRLADISVNARFFKEYKTDQIKFTFPITIDHFCLVGRKAQKIPNWLNILQAFDMITWYVIFGTVTLLCVIWWGVKTKLMLVIERGHRYDYNVIIDILSLIVNQPVILPSQAGERVFMTVCLFFNLLVVTLFQGYLTTAYTTTRYYKDIDTLQEAYDSGLRVAASMDDLFGVDISPLMTSLGTRIINYDLPTIAMVEPLNVFTLERRTDASVMIERNYTSPTGEPRLHIVQECPRFYYLNYIVYKGYPFLGQINRFIMSIDAAGLLNKWYDITSYSLLLKHRQEQAHDDEHKPLTLNDTQAAFYSLVIGLSISIFVFCCELLHDRFLKRFRMLTVQMERAQTNSWLRCLGIQI